MLIIKKAVCTVLSTAMLLSALFLCSCGYSEKPVHLDTGFLTKEYRTNNITAFYNPDCKHDIRYLPAASVDENYPDSEYHYVYCVYGNCDFEGHFEKHSDTLVLKTWRGTGRIMANGIHYHEVYFACPVCNINYYDEAKIPTYPIVLYIACKKQGEECASVRECRGWTVGMEFSREELEGK